MAEKSNATYGPFQRDQIVKIRNNELAWKIIEITGNVVVLESGQTGRRRRETMDQLVPWGAAFRG